MPFCVSFLIFGFSLVYCYLLSQIISTTDQITNESVLTRNTNKTYPVFDFSTYPKRQYTLWIEKSRFFSHLGDEKEIASSFLTTMNVGDTVVQNSADIVNFFKEKKESLFKECTDFREFSHCQLFYLFQYDTGTHKCHGYIRENYIQADYTGITLVLGLSANRMNRLPLHLERWDESMSIALFLEESELPTISSIITNTNRTNIRFTLYIMKEIPNTKNRCSFVLQNKQKMMYPMCFPTNVLRDLAIETIRTTHYLILDGDSLITKSFTTNVKDFIPLISDESEVLVIPLFSCLDPSCNVCIKTGNCSVAWSRMPTTKKQITRNRRSWKKVKRRHKIMDYVYWSQLNQNKVLQLKFTPFMEPYGVFKRTIRTPLFHPYWINYGRNKEDFYRVLNTMGYHYNVVSLDFLIDLPHPQTIYAQQVKKSSPEFSKQHIYYFDNMHKTYCYKHVCNYYQNRPYRRLPIV